MKTECAWCGNDLGTAATDPPHGPTSHGICASCVGDLLDLPVTDIYALTEEEADALPFGLMELSAEGEVRRYNRFEAELSRLDPERVIGKNFFTEIAPCTRETVVENTFRELIAAGGGDADLTFVFRFAHGHQLVRIRMLVDPAKDRHLIMVQDDEKADRSVA